MKNFNCQFSHNVNYLEDDQPFRCKITKREKISQSDYKIDNLTKFARRVAWISNFSSKSILAEGPHKFISFFTLPFSSRYFRSLPIFCSGILSFLHLRIFLRHYSQLFLDSAKFSQIYWIFFLSYFPSKFLIPILLAFFQRIFPVRLRIFSPFVIFSELSFSLGCFQFSAFRNIRSFKILHASGFFYNFHSPFFCSFDFENFEMACAIARDRGEYEGKAKWFSNR